MAKRGRIDKQKLQNQVKGGQLRRRKALTLASSWDAGCSSVRTFACGSCAHVVADGRSTCELVVNYRGKPEE